MFLTLEKKSNASLVVFCGSLSVYLLNWLFGIETEARTGSKVVLQKQALKVEAKRLLLLVGTLKGLPGGSSYRELEDFMQKLQ